MREFDLVVIGGGSAGLKAARTAARLGRSVLLAEERELGGECFWAGCVPTKAMVRAAQVWHLVRRCSDFGITVDILETSFAKAMEYKEKVIRKVGGDGPEDGGLSKLGAVYVNTRASFESSHEVRIGDEVVYGRQIILAAGTVPYIPPVDGLGQSGYITNREAANLTSLPGRIVIIGGGPIGLEFAQIFRRFGSEITLIDKNSYLLKQEDNEIAELARGFLEAEGVRIITKGQTERVETIEDGKRVFVRHGGETISFDCDEILVAAGRRIAPDTLNLDAAGIAYEEKRVVTDRFLRTSVPHIWAAGDVCGGYLFTHVASYEGKLAALNAFTDQPEPFDHRVVPRCTFIDPEVGSIGLTEQKARELGLGVHIQSFSFADLDRAIIHGEPHGMVKLIVDDLDGQILGAHLIGPDASSVLAELAVCMKNHLPISAIADTMHAYPSFPEVVEAAALSAPNYRGQVEGATS